MGPHWYRMPRRNWTKIGTVKTRGKELPRWRLKFVESWLQAGGNQRREKEGDPAALTF